VIGAIGLTPSVNLSLLILVDSLPIRLRMRKKGGLFGRPPFLNTSVGVENGPELRAAAPTGRP